MAIHLLIIAVAAATLIVLTRPERVFSKATPQREPPLVRVSVWKFLRNRSHVLDIAAAESPHKVPPVIFTVTILGWRIYVVNSARKDC